MGKNGKKGVRIEASFGRDSSGIRLNIKATNMAEIVITELEVQMKPNFFNLTIEKLGNSVTLFPNQTQVFSFNVGVQGQGDNTPPSIPLLFVMGVKTTLDIFYFNAPCMFHCLLVTQSRWLSEFCDRLRAGCWRRRTSRCCGSRFRRGMSLSMRIVSL